MQKIEAVKNNRRNISQKNLNDLKELIASERGTKEISLPDEVRAVRAYDKLDFFGKKEDNLYSVQQEIKLKMGENPFGDWKFTVKKSNLQADEIKKNNDKFKLYTSAVNLHLISVRKQIAGDRIKIIGLDGHKKLQDLFTDAKIKREDRESWPVFVGPGGKILWIPGLAIGSDVETKAPLLEITARKAK